MKSDGDCTNLYLVRVLFLGFTSKGGDPLKVRYVRIMNSFRVYIEGFYMHTHFKLPVYEQVVIKSLCDSDLLTVSVA